MGSTSETVEGYLLLADISGYTEFLTQTEIDHGSAIIAGLTGLIRERLEPRMRFVKLEGDAVLCHAEGKRFGDGERLLELIEACYLAFSNRLRDMELETTCSCRACASIGLLDLKFVAHHGRYLIGREGGQEDLSGSDVILAHRLLKNSVCEGEGPAAYALLSDACLRRLPPSVELRPHTESYEHFGEVNGGVHDLGSELERMRSEHRVRVSADEADLELGDDFSHPPEVVWRYFVEPELRLRWQTRFQTAVRTRPNEEGRTGKGATSHCEHGAAGDAIRTYVDWRPHAYFTVKFTPVGRGRLTLLPALETFEFEPLSDGTRLRYRYKLEDPGPLMRARWRFTRPTMGMMLSRSLPRLDRILGEDAAERQAAAV